MYSENLKKSMKNIFCTQVPLFLLTYKRIFVSQTRRCIDQKIKRNRSINHFGALRSRRLKRDLRNWPEGHWDVWPSANTTPVTQKMIEYQGMIIN